jgi:hypothetical protein
MMSIVFSEEVHMRVLTTMAVAAAGVTMLTLGAGKARAWDGDWDPPAAAAALVAQAQQHAAGAIVTPLFSRDHFWKYDRPGFGACYLLQVGGPDGTRFVRACP